MSSSTRFAEKTILYVIVNRAAAFASSIDSGCRVASWSPVAVTVSNLRCHLSTSPCRRYQTQQQQQPRRAGCNSSRCAPVIRRISATATIGSQKTSQSRGSANCPTTAHHWGLHRHRHCRERVILRNYCSGSPRRNVSRVQSIGGECDAIEEEATTTTVGARRDNYLYIRSTCIDTRSLHWQTCNTEQTETQT